MIDPVVVGLSRLQFAATAMYHFLFVPLTIGLAWMLVIMESCYVMTGNTIWKDMTRFWGKLFGINFAMGVTTGLTLEFQFGTNWAYYSHYVGDIFGAPLAIEGMLAFFLESTMVGLFFFGWDRLSKVGHLAVTTLMAMGANMSAFLILVANAWMQEPVGSFFNPVTMRMELSDFTTILLSHTTQAKFIHTIAACYCTGAMFVLGVSAWHLLKGKNLEFAKRSFRVAAIFGLFSTISVIILGDESGVGITRVQPSKLAAIEAMWETEPAPASLNLIAGINEKEERNDWAISVPYVGGLITTRSTTQQVPGIHDIRAENRQRIERGIQAVLALEAMRQNPQDTAARARFAEHQQDMGYGLLLKRYTNDLTQATPAMMDQAAHDSVPRVEPLFWGFRAMVGLGGMMLLLTILAVWHCTRNTFMQQRWLLRWAFWGIPAPWLAAQLGWFVAEYGRQPWTVFGMLPTHMSTSSVSAGTLWASLAGFVIFYTVLLVVEIYLMLKYARMGPAALQADHT